MHALRVNAACGGASSGTDRVLEFGESESKSQLMTMLRWPPDGLTP